MSQVSPAKYWIGTSFLDTPEKVIGALWLAHQQYMDGLGKSEDEWTGLTTEQLYKFFRDPYELAVELLNSTKHHV